MTITQLGVSPFKIEDPQLAKLYNQSVDLAAKMAECEASKGKGSQDYLNLQKQMQKILKAMRAIDPEGDKTPFNYQVWTHSAKPWRKQNTLNSGD